VTIEWNRDTRQIESGTPEELASANSDQVVGSNNVV
jgi:hypothetical protein